MDKKDNETNAFEIEELQIDDSSINIDEFPSGSEGDDVKEFIPNSKDNNSSVGDSDEKEDNYVIGENFELSKTAEKNRPKAKRKKKKKGGFKSFVKGLIWAIIIIGVSAGVVIGGITCAIDYLGLGRNVNKTIVIEENFSLDDLSKELEQDGIIKYPFLFKLYSSKKGYSKEFKPGVHKISSNMGYAGIVHEFATAKGYSVKTASVAINATDSIDKIAKKLAKNKICSTDDFYDVIENSYFDYGFINNIPIKKVHYRLEGYLYPDTYEFYQWNSKDGAEFAVNKMLENYNSKFTPKMRERAEKLGYSMHEVTTLASIVELECCGFNDDMPNVAAVFRNRLENWEGQPKLLGSSPTADYPYGNGKYDTNKVEGIPPGAYCATSKDAIKAVLYPNKKYMKKYFYFVTDTKQNFYYGRTVEEHESIIASLRAKGIWGE